MSKGQGPLMGSNHNKMCDTEMQQAAELFMN